MELHKLYNIAEKENISIINFKMQNKAIIGCLGNNCAIGVNYSIIDISKKEFRATKWAFKSLVPLKKLEELYKKGYRYTYEFAEKLGVTEELIEKAYNYYSEGNYG